MAQLHEPWGRRKGNHDRKSLLWVDLRTTTTASFSNNEEQVRDENPKTACGKVAEKNETERKNEAAERRRRDEEKNWRKKRNCYGRWWGAVKTC